MLVFFRQESAFRKSSTSSSQHALIRLPHCNLNGPCAVIFRSHCISCKAPPITAIFRDTVREGPWQKGGGGLAAGWESSAVLAGPGSWLGPGWGGGCAAWGVWGQKCAERAAQFLRFCAGKNQHGKFPDEFSGEKKTNTEIFRDPHGMKK